MCTYACIREFFFERRAKHTTNRKRFKQQQHSLRTKSKQRYWCIVAAQAHGFSAPFAYIQNATSYSIVFRMVYSSHNILPQNFLFETNIFRLTSNYASCITLRALVGICFHSCSISTDCYYFLYQFTWKFSWYASIKSVTKSSWKSENQFNLNSKLGKYFLMIFLGNII